MAKKSRKNVGLVGLGIIGSRVANALRQAGFHVYVWNRTPRAVANFLASPRQVAELCDIIQLFVSDAQALFEVLDSMGDALTSSHIILCDATVGPEATLDAARMVHERGARFLDAPFTGSRAAADSRELVYFIGGDDKTLQAAEPVLKASSKAIVKIGKIGDAATVKVATNMLAAVAVQTLAEAYAIVKGSGIDPAVFSEALKHHAIRSGVLDAKLDKMLSRDYEPHFSLKHMFKDVQLGIHIANSLDIDLPATTSTAGVMYGALTRGWADQDFSVLARTYQGEKQMPALSAPEVAPPITFPPATAQNLPAGQTSPAAETSSPGPISPAPQIPPLTQPSAELPADSPKSDPGRELTAAELLDGGVKMPEVFIPPPPPVETPPISPSAEVKPEPEPVVTPDSKKEPVEKSVTEQPARPINASEIPTAQSGEGEPAHPPFVRIRRWFGTNSQN